MALVLKDRVKETTTTTGTGSVSLLGAAVGYQSFSAIGDGNTCYYAISSPVGNQWEVGLGTYTLSGSVLSRDTVLSSSNLGSLVNLSAGTKDVYIVYPAEKAIYEEANGETLIDGGPITVIGAGVTSVPALPAELGKFVADEDLFAQIYNINQNDGSSASADFVVYNDLTTDGYTHFTDMGINSSNYTSVDYPIFTPGSGYLFHDGDHLFIGTATSDKDVVIFTGGVDTPNEAMRIFGTDQSVELVGNLNVGGTLDVTGNATFGGTVTLDASPTQPLQAATKQYVDQVASAGLHIHEPVLVETTGNLTASYVQGGTTFDITDITGTDTVTTSVNHGLSLNDQIWLYTSAGNGLSTNTAYFVFSIPALNQLTLSLTFGGAQITGLTNASGLTYPTRANSGVGATLTNSGSQAALVVDNVAMTVADRVMVRLQTASEHNGVYEVTDIGSGSTNWVLTRTADANRVDPGDPNGLGTGDYFFTLDGDINAGDSHVLTTEPNTMIIGYTGLTYELFSATPTFTGTAPINVSGQNISLTGTVAATNGGTGTSTVTTGDLLYGSATNTWSKLPAGAGYRSLVMNAGGTQVEWNAVALNQANAISGTLGPTNGGTGQAGYSTGDILYSSSTDTLARLAGNTTTSKKYLSQTGTGSASQAPSWEGISAADIGAGVLPAIYGGTGQSSYTVGDLVYADTTTTLAKLPDVATGNVLLSGGANTAPAYGKVGLGTHISGTLAVSNGGTGLSSLTANSIFYSSTTSAIGQTSTFVYNSSNGRLGVGIASPASILDVRNGSGIAQITVVGGTASSTQGDAVLYLQANNASGTSGAFAQVAATQDAAGDTTASRLYFTTRDAAGTSAERMQLNSSGNLGLGVTPSAWGSFIKAIDVGNFGSYFAGGTTTYSGSGYTFLGNNAYLTEGNAWTYKRTAASVQYRQAIGEHQWFTAPSGTAGNAITFTQAMTLDASGNLGLGVTPSAWSTSYKPIEIGRAGNAIMAGVASSSMEMMTNCFLNTSGSYRYTSNGAATDYYQNAGAHIWYNAPSGTAGNAITFTQAMTLDASGNLGIGIASPTNKLQVTGGGLTVTGTSPAFTANAAIIDVNASGFTRINAAGADNATQGTMLFNSTNASGGISRECIRIDSSGNVGISNSSPTTSGPSNFRNLVVGSTAFNNSGITVQTFNTGQGGLIFNDTAGGTQGGVVYSHSSNALYLRTNSIDRVIIDSTGSLLVGDDLPVSTSFGRVISVRNVAGNSAALRVTNSSTGATLNDGFEVGSINLDAYVFNRENGSIFFGTNNTEKMRIASNGNVGINTNGAPSAKLEVSDANAFSVKIIRPFIAQWEIGVDTVAYSATDSDMSFRVNGPERMRIAADGYTFLKNAGNDGIVPGSFYYRTNATIVGANSTAALDVYGVGVSLAAGTIYEIEGQFWLAKTAGTTSSLLNFRLTAESGLTANNLQVHVTSRLGATVTAVEAVDQYGSINALNTNLALFAASTTAALGVIVTFKGTVSVNVAGTLTPQYSQSAASGGAWTAQIGNYMKATPLGPAGVINIGSWA